MRQPVTIITNKNLISCTAYGHNQVSTAKLWLNNLSLSYNKQLLKTVNESFITFKKMTNPNVSFCQ